MAPGTGCGRPQLPQAQVHSHYAFRIDALRVVPDPASRSNPLGVHAASGLTDPYAFEWPDDGWRGRDWCEAVIYELHVGCFTAEGTFMAAIDRLDDLVALGVTAIELMPVADFSGQRGWGYDGVLPFAPKSIYGQPDELKRLVAAAHHRELMVFLDVVYNHFGPDGNYLHATTPAFFNTQVSTPWGAAINFDAQASGTVREFFVHNALYWIEEFQIDGLRIDAVHAMHDRSARHFVEELALAVHAGPGRERSVHLILENDRNDAERLVRDDTGRALCATAQWNDDVHHALHVLVTGETLGYYMDYMADPTRLFARALAEGFAYQGEASAYRNGQPRGTASAHLPPLAFVNALQTHDQVGNRAFGERIAALCAVAGAEPALRALVACVLLAPSPPMLFMGEEWAAGTPFLYFCDFQGELAEAVRRGRRADVAHRSRCLSPVAHEVIPDPNDENAFLRSKLDWSERTREPHRGWLRFYADLLHCRRDHLMPWLPGARSGTLSIPAPGTLELSWPLGAGRQWHLRAQLAAHEAAEHVAGELPGKVVYRSHPASARAPAWSVVFAMETR